MVSSKGRSTSSAAGSSEDSLARGSKKPCAQRGKRRAEAVSAPTEVKYLPGSARRASPVKRYRNTSVATLNGKGAPAHPTQELIIPILTDAVYLAQRRVLTLPVPDSFDFSMAICSYGFFCMMPNKWVPAPMSPAANTNAANPTFGAELKMHGTLRRPLRYGEQARRCCIAEITCQEPSCLHVTLAGDITFGEAEEAEIIGQIRRMCRLDVSNPVEQFWRLHPEAKARAFGYLFRSPTVWEDMVKTMTICNVRWKQSLVMNRLLCNVASSLPGSFPSPWDIARYSTEELQRLCSLGYRAERVRRLAGSIINGSLDIAFFDACQSRLAHEVDISTIPRHIESNSATSPRKRIVNNAGKTHKSGKLECEVMDKLLSIYGFGKFAAENMMQLLGFFDVDAFDSETIRHMREVHGFTDKDNKRVQEAARRRYEPYRPFRFLAYWFELWKMYEAQTGLESRYWAFGNSFFVDGG